MKFELSNEDYQRLFGDRQQQNELLEYSYQMLDDALRELAKNNDMITKEEIKDHLEHTVYSSGARKSIIGFLVGRGVDTNDIEFAKRNCSARECNAKTFEDFVIFVRDKELENRAKEYLKEGLDNRPMPKFSWSAPRIEMLEEATKKLAEAVDAFLRSEDKNDTETDDFHVGDWVKYIPEPSESSTECIEAIAHDSDGEMYLCLSNGEYVRPCYCVKYKVQGEERRKLIDKLNEVA